MPNEGLGVGRAERGSVGVAAGFPWYYGPVSRQFSRACRAAAGDDRQRLHVQIAKPPPPLGPQIDQPGAAGLRATPRSLEHATTAEPDGGGLSNRRYVDRPSSRPFGDDLPATRFEKTPPEDKCRGSPGRRVSGLPSKESGGATYPRTPGPTAPSSFATTSAAPPRTDRGPIPRRSDRRRSRR